MNHLSNPIGSNSLNYHGYNPNVNTVNTANSSNKYHESMLNWYDFTSTVNKNTEAAAIASLSNFFHKQQAENVSTYSKMMATTSNTDYSMAAYTDSNTHNSAISSTNWNNSTVHSSAGNGRSLQNQQLDSNRQFINNNNNNTHQTISHQNQYNTQPAHMSTTNSLNNFFASTKPPLKSAVSQEDLASNSNSGQSRPYQNQASNLNANTATGQSNLGYGKPSTAGSMPRSASSTNNSMLITDNYQRNILNQNSSNTHDSLPSNPLLRNTNANNSTGSYQRSNYATNQPLPNQPHPSSILNHSSSFSNAYTGQFSNSHGGSGSSSNIHSTSNHLSNNSSLQTNSIQHHQAISHHLNNTPAAAAAAAAAIAATAAFPHNRQAAAMSSIFAATNQFSNVPQFNPW